MPETEYRTLIKEMPEDERPRERLERLGERLLSTHELLAIALRTGSQHENAVGLAQRLLKTFDDLNGLAKASVRELCAVSGIGPAKATQVKASLELGRRLNLAAVDREQVSSPQEAAAAFRTRVDTDVQEELWVMLLDTKHRMLRLCNVYVGNVNSSVVRTCEVFREAVKDNATAIIVAHTHPSGDPTPSPEDIQVTDAIVRAGNVLDIKVLDHLILAGQRFISMKERGMGHMR